MKVVICGAGPAGLLLANKLIERSNYHVVVYEKYADPETLNQDDRRTFPIALQPRGMESIDNQDIMSALEKRGQWTTGIYIHPAQLEKKARVINKSGSLSIDRNDLTHVILQHLRQKTIAGKGSKLEIHFNSRIEDIDLDKKLITGTGINGNAFTTGFDKIVAADGANSLIRKRLAEQGEISFEQERTTDSYKSFYINLQSNDGISTLEEGGVHTWTREKIRIISVHVSNDFCSGVYIFPTGTNPFEDLKDEKEVQAYIHSLFPSLAQYVPDTEALKLLERPVASQWTVQADRLHVRDCVLLMGDAAHAVSASLGQGCNSALEDVRIFTSMLAKLDDDWDTALPEFTKDRLPDAHAVKILSDYAMPRTPLMRFEWITRIILRKILPSFFVRWFMRPLPMDLLNVKPVLKYQEALRQSNWWVQRVKKSMGK